MVGVVSSVSSGGNFIFADFGTSRCQCCTKLPEMSDLCYLGKTRIFQLVRGGMSITYSAVFQCIQSGTCFLADSESPNLSKWDIYPNHFQCNNSNVAHMY